MRVAVYKKRASRRLLSNKHTQLEEPTRRTKRRNNMSSRKVEQTELAGSERAARSGRAREDKARGNQVHTKSREADRLEREVASEDQLLKEEIDEEQPISTTMISIYMHKDRLFDTCIFIKPGSGMIRDLDEP